MLMNINKLAIDEMIKNLMIILVLHFYPKMFF